MLIRTAAMFLACLSLPACAPHRSNSADPSPAAPVVMQASPLRVSATEPLTIGDSFTIDSAIMGESRRINVFVPTIYGEKLGGKGQEQREKAATRRWEIRYFTGKSVGGA